MKPLKSTDVKDMAYAVLVYSQQQLVLGLDTVKSLKVQGSLN
jgi:hypothetical protein